MALEREVDPAVVRSLRQKLADPAVSLQQKYRVLFSLRNIAGSEAHEAMLLGLQDPSALFRHEVAYCLGQRQDPAAVATLTAILKDASEHPMVRHEAGEALGAIGTPACLQPLHDHQADPCLEVAQTCQLAVQRMEYFAAQQAAAGGGGAGAGAAAAAAAAAAGGGATDGSEGPSPFLSVDPTPAAPASVPTAELARLLLDEEERIFQRYRAMFALRNRAGPAAVDALAACFATSRSALLKHEAAYVLGQMQDPRAVGMLRQVLADAGENAMVRHEAAEALGSIAAPECLVLLQQYASDPEPIVAHSCEVALDMLEFEQSGAAEYADMGA